MDINKWKSQVEASLGEDSIEESFEEALYIEAEGLGEDVPLGKKILSSTLMVLMVSWVLYFGIQVGLHFLDESYGDCLASLLMLPVAPFLFSFIGRFSHPKI